MSLLVAGLTRFYGPGSYRTDGRRSSERIIEDILRKGDISACNQIKPGLVLLHPLVGAFADDTYYEARTRCHARFAHEEENCEICGLIRIEGLPPEFEQNAEGSCHQMCEGRPSSIQ